MTLNYCQILQLTKLFTKWWDEELVFSILELKEIFQALFSYIWTHTYENNPKLK